ncbi:MAG: class I SAM-dependent methyltransferase [Gammaproteobacteria bacterium]
MNTWEEVRKLMNTPELTMGPYFSSQIKNDPKHLLFTLSRYKFAYKMLPSFKKNKILELGCSEGLGALLLSDNKNDILGVDSDALAIEQANKTLATKNIKFKCKNFVGEFFGYFDAVVSLDVIEHIDKENENKFLETVVNNLSEEGIALIGTPNETANQYASEASKIGHINLFDAKRLEELMRNYFSYVFIFGLNDEVVHTGFHPMCHYLVALCCGAKIRSTKSLNRVIPT